MGIQISATIRTKYIIDTCQGIFKKKILDVGCGAGILSESLYYAGGIVTGLDISNILQHCIKNSEYYDIVVCMEVLEHIERPIEIVNLCSKLIKPGGNLFFSTINRTLKSFFTLNTY
uniref:Methyltransferase type 11 domain-containing protein n=1 Tax=Glossina palpalis gambiensis TaxID=67801 RepID=A0A1B0C7N4_9MUSC